MGYALRARAQQPVRQPMVAVLSPDRAGPSTCDAGAVGFPVACLRDGLSALGHVEGRNITFEYRFSDGDFQKMTAMAAELVALRPDVLYTVGTQGADAAAKATVTIPIVVGLAGEPTLNRLAGNLARPMGNLTGFTTGSFGYETIEKCLQLLKELAPRTTRVAVIHHPDNKLIWPNIDVLAAAAGQLGIGLLNVGARDGSELPQAFATILAGGADAIYISPENMLGGSPEVRKQVSDWALGHRMPSASTFAHFTVDGGLVSLGPDFAAITRRSAFYVHRLLGGARPGDLPVERATIFKLSVNRKTAAALGLTIPKALLLRADEVIQ